MKLYFSIQFKRICRHFVDFGLPTILGFAIIAIGFVYGSNYFFEKTAYSEYIYPFLTLPIFFALAEKKRNFFLKNMTSTNDYKNIRWIENFLTALPFAIFLFYKSYYIIAIILLICAVLVSFINTNSTFNLIIPTPFGKRPFEFTIGFRKAFLIFIPLYALAYLAVSVPNINLGIFGVFGICFVCMSFVLQTEPKFYIWIFNNKPVQFLNTKIKTTLLYTFLLCLPLVIILCVFSPSEIENILLALGLGLSVTVLGLLSKYATYPHKLTFVFGVLLLVSLLFPPILIVLIPYFYHQSIKKISPLLK